MPIRYIRDWSNGYGATGYNYWNEISVTTASGTNAALGLGAVFSNGVLAPRVTNGITTDGDYTSPGPVGNQWALIDLGSIRSDIVSVTVWHYIGGGRSYHGTKTEVSPDAATWFTLFDSAVSGEYVETLPGRTSPVLGTLLTLFGNGQFCCPRKNPPRPQMSPTINQATARSSGGVSYAHDPINTEMSIPLNWTNINATDVVSLRAFFNSMDGLTTPFSLYEPWGKTTSTVEFAEPTMNITETGPDSYSASCQLRRVM